MTTRQAPNDTSLAVRLNRWTQIFSRRWLTILLIFVAIYAGLPVAAPFLMKAGLTGAGETIYSLYSSMCHQYSFRSWFLFGEQAVYPREAAHIGGLQPYESFLSEVDATIKAQNYQPPPGYIEAAPSADQALGLQSKYFLGNEQLGYKIAVCQRDVGIWWALLIGGMVYSIPVVRKYLRPVPWWLYILLGIVPIGIDGFSQLLSAPLPPIWTQGFWPLRESTPFFRTITGALFGLMNAWLAFPYLEESAREVDGEISAKFARREQRLQRESSKS
ncbi:MAG: DUF2085 domain-containing protein [Anaerolineae bacterium]|nr:DUF2085 domain-containing protein [Anaerolineae bacterium]